MGDCSWKVILKKPPQKAGLGGLRHNIDPKFFPLKKMSSRENSQRSARENKNASRENYQILTVKTLDYPFKFSKKWAWKRISTREKNRKKEQTKKGFHGQFWFSREKKTLPPILPKSSKTVDFKWRIRAKKDWKKC